MWLVLFTTNRFHSFFFLDFKLFPSLTLFPTVAHSLSAVLLPLTGKKKGYRILVLEQIFEN